MADAPSPRVLSRTVLLKKASVSGLKSGVTPRDSELWLMIVKGIDANKEKQKWVRMRHRTETHCEWQLRSPVPVEGDVKIEVLSRQKKGKVAKVLMYCCFHASFIGRKLVLYKNEVDKVFKDVYHERFDENLTFEVGFTNDEAVDAICVLNNGTSARCKQDHAIPTNENTHTHTPSLK